MTASLSENLAAGPSMGRPKANVLHGARIWRVQEHDFCFAV